MIPKTLQKFADENDVDITILHFRYSGIRIKRPGYSIHRKETKMYHGLSMHRVLFELEPIEYGDDRWYLCTVPREYHGKRYFKRISKEMLSNKSLLGDSFMLINNRKFNKIIKCNYES